MLWIVNGYGEDLVPEVDAAESLDESRRFWPTGWPNLREGGESRVWEFSHCPARYRHHHNEGPECCVHMFPAILAHPLFRTTLSYTGLQEVSGF